MACISIISSFVEVWQALVTYVVGLFPSIIELFYVAETGLTFVGVIAVIMAGVALLLLVFNLIRSFLPMRG